MRAADYVRSRVYGRAAEGRLAPVRAVSPLVAPVYEADDEVDVLPRREGGDARAQLVLRRAPGRGVDADAYPVPVLVDITRIRSRVGDAVVIERGARVVEPGLAEIYGVVVAERDELDAALAEHGRVEAAPRKRKVAPPVSSRSERTHSRFAIVISSKYSRTPEKG